MGAGMKILLVEDDAHIVAMLQRGLEEEGHHVTVATDGEEGEYRALFYTYDIIVLDWMLPFKSGPQIITRLRKERITTPVLMLTAKGEIQDKVGAFKEGADDYLVKPFAYEELLARLEALYRRALGEGSDILTFGELTVDLDKNQVQRGKDVIALTHKEFELLLFLMRHKERVVSRQMLEAQLWEESETVQSNVIDVTLYHLRQKIGKNYIKSVRGLGYKIET